MKLLYGKYFEARYQAIADLIPKNATVVDVCAGDAYLYRHYLKAKDITYTGLDINPVFVRAGKRNNISFIQHDLFRDNIPSAEYVVIQASLYQFMPQEISVINKLMDAAQHALIIAEPVRNLSESGNSFIKLVAKYSANPGKNHPTNRFNQETLSACFRKFKELKDVKTIDGGREMIGIFHK